MPKRKIRDSLPPNQKEAVLAAIREVHKHPKELTLDEERDFLERRAHGHIERDEYIVTIDQSGKRVYRKPGKAGANLPEPPYYWNILKSQRDFETQCAKLARTLNLPFLHKRKAAERAQHIHELAKTITEHGRIKRIARKVGCSVSTVRRALGK